MRPIVTLIIDDEELALKRVKTLVEGDKDFIIHAACMKSIDAAKIIAEDPIDLLLLDIEMPGMNGLELLNKIEINAKPLVVFITAYDEYAVQAFEYYAIDYVLKPFSNERFQKMLDRVRSHFINQYNNNIPWADVKNSIEKGTITNRITVKTGKKYNFIDYSGITYIRADGNYCEINTGEGLRYIHRDTLNHLATILPGDQFSRIHHSYIISVRSVVEVKRTSFGEMSVKMSDGNWLKVSRKYKGIIKDLIR